MNDRTPAWTILALIGVSLAAFTLLGCLGGCGKVAKQLAQSLADQRAKRPPHERLGWKAEDFFSDNGVISLCKAIEKRDLVEIQRLVKSGVSVNAKGRGNMTPLLWAFPMGEAVFGKMLALGADPNVRLTGRALLGALDIGKSVMSASVELGDGPIYHQMFYDVGMDNYLKLLLNHGGNPNLEDLDGDTPIFFPRNFRRGGVNVRLLLDNGADINHRNRQGKTPLVSAAGWYEHMLTLLKAGADYRIADDNGFDLIIQLEWLRVPTRPGGPAQSSIDEEAIRAKPVFEWLTDEGVNWQAARAAWESRETMKNLKNLPADYKHRPWLPQRPTLKKPEAKRKRGRESLIFPAKAQPPAAARAPLGRFGQLDRHKSRGEIESSRGCAIGGNQRR